MEKLEYLKKMGWDAETYHLLTKEEFNKEVMDAPQRVNNVYEVLDPPGVKVFGKGSYVVKTSWYNDNLPKVVEEIPAPPELPSNEITPLLKSRLMNLIDKDWTDNDDQTMTSSNGSVFTYQEIEDFSNEEYTAIIKTKPEISEILQTRIDTLVSMGCSIINDSIDIGNTQIPFSALEAMTPPIFQDLIQKKGSLEEKVEPVEIASEEDFEIEEIQETVEEVFEDLKLEGEIDELSFEEEKEEEESFKDVETTGSYQGLFGIIAKLGLKVSGGSEKEASEETLQTISEAENILGNIIEKAIDKKTSPKPIEKEELLKQLDFVDDVISACTTFKEAMFALHTIKEVLEEDLTPGKKVNKIKRAIKKL